MTDTQPETTTPAGGASGRDLARQALAAYKATAHTTPASQATSRVRNRNRRRAGDGRDPMAFGALIGRLADEQGWRRGVDGGGIIGRWAELCPQYADGQVSPVHYDPDLGRLDVRPTSHAYAAQLRLLGGQLARQINDKTGSDSVRSIRVLPVGAAGNGSAADAPPRAAEPQQPVKTREMAGDGYKAVRDLLLTHRPETLPLNPHIAAAITRQNDAARANRLPWDEHIDAVHACEEPSGPEPGSLEASLAAARAYKHRVEAGLEPAEPRRVFDVA